MCVLVSFPPPPPLSLPLTEGRTCARAFAAEVSAAWPQAAALSFATAAAADSASVARAAMVCSAVSFFGALRLLSSCGARFGAAALCETTDLRTCVRFLRSRVWAMVAAGVGVGRRGRGEAAKSNANGEENGRDKAREKEAPRCIEQSMAQAASTRPQQQPQEENAAETRRKTTDRVQNLPRKIRLKFGCILAGSWLEFIGLSSLPTGKRCCASSPFPFWLWLLLPFCTPRLLPFVVSFCRERR